MHNKVKCRCICVLVVKSRFIFLSDIRGVDAVDCGNFTHMCKSISYAVEIVASDNDTVYVDGGQNKNIVYLLTNSITVSKSIHITKLSKLSPVISTAKLNTAAVFAFNIINGNALTLNSFQFMSINILQGTLNKSSNYTLKMVNCSVVNNVLVSSINIMSNSVTNIYINGCIFRQLAVMNINITGKLFLWVNNTYIHGKMKINASVENEHSSRIVIHNIIASKSVAVEVQGCFQLHVNHSLFTNISSKKPILYTNSVHPDCIPKVRLHECMFTLNKISNDLIRSVSSPIYISKCMVANNVIIAKHYYSVFNIVDSNFSLYLTNITNNSYSASNTMRNFIIRAVVSSIYDKCPNFITTVQLCNITNNTARHFFYGYITVDVQLCKFQHNIFSHFIYVDSNCNIKVYSCGIKYNMIKKTLFTAMGSPIVKVDKCTIAYNNVSNYLLRGQLSSNVSMNFCNITYNRLNSPLFFGSGIDAYGIYGSFIIHLCNIEHNILTQSLYFTFDHVILRMHTCNIKYNIVRGSLFKLDYHNNVSIQCCIIAYNKVKEYLMEGNANSNITVHLSHINCNYFSTMFYLKSFKTLQINSTNVKNNIVKYLPRTNRFMMQNLESGYLIRAKNAEIIKLHFCNIHNNTVLFHIISSEVCSIDIRNTTFIFNKGEHLFKYISSTVTKISVNISYNTIFQSNKSNHAIDISNSSLIFFNEVRMEHNKMELPISLQDSTLCIIFSVFIDNSSRTAFLRTYKSNLRIASSVFIHNSAYDNIQSIKFATGYGAIIHISLTNVNITWQPSNYVKYLPLIYIDAKNAIVQINNLNVNLLKLKDKTPVIYVSVTSTYSSTEKNFVTANVECSMGFDPTYAKKSTKNTVEFHSSCSPCAAGTYSLTKRNKHIIWKSKRKLKTNISDQFISNITNNSVASTSPDTLCIECPVGGTCVNGIKSSGNFYGYQTFNDRIKFLTCIQSYCCSKNSKKCTSYNTCNYNRNGILCGACNTGYYESYFDTKCIHKNTCTKQELFWVIFLTSSFLFTIFLLYIRDVKTVLKRIGRVIKTKLKFNQNARINSRMSLEQPLLSNAQNESNENESVGNSFVSLENIEVKHKTVPPKQYTISGILASLVMFYQVRSLLTADISEIYSKSDNFSSVLEKIFNFHFSFSFISSYCPLQDLNALTKHVLKNVMFISSMLMFLALILITKVGSQCIIKCSKYCLLLSKRIRKNKFSAHHRFAQVEREQIQQTNVQEQFHAEGNESLNSRPQQNSILVNQKAESQFFDSQSVQDQSLESQLLNQPLDNRPPQCISKNGICENQTNVIEKHPINNSMYSKIGLCYVRMLIYGFKNFAIFCFVLLHCEYVNGEKHLYIMGEIICFRWWQILPSAVIIPWLVVFPIALSVSLDLYRKNHISFLNFIASITCPLYTIYLYCRKKTAKDSLLDNNLDMLIEMLEEPYRSKISQDCWFFLWEAWRLYQRLILVLITTYIIDPILRTCILTLIIITFIAIYWKVKPYKESMYLLHWMNVASLLSFCFLTVYNMFASVMYVFDIHKPRRVAEILKVFKIFDHLLSPVIVLVWYFILQPLVVKLIRLCGKLKSE